MIYLAESLQEYGCILESILYQPILESKIVDDNYLSYDISFIKNKQLGAHFWQELFERIMHIDLGIAKPSISAVKEFA